MEAGQLHHSAISHSLPLVASRHFVGIAKEIQIIFRMKISFLLLSLLVVAETRRGKISISIIGTCFNSPYNLQLESLPKVMREREIIVEMYDWIWQVAIATPPPPHPSRPRPQQWRQRPCLPQQRQRRLPHQWMMRTRRISRSRSTMWRWIAMESNSLFSV